MLVHGSPRGIPVARNGRIGSAWLAMSLGPLAIIPSGMDTIFIKDLRIETRTRQLIDDAAAALGKTRTEFMIESARKVAIDVILNQRLFVLDPKRYDAFLDALDNPPAPGVKLRALLRRAPAWKS